MNNFENKQTKKKQQQQQQQIENCIRPDECHMLQKWQVFVSFYSWTYAMYVIIRVCTERDQLNNKVRWAYCLYCLLSYLTLIFPFITKDSSTLKFDRQWCFIDFNFTFHVSYKFMYIFFRCGPMFNLTCIIYMVAINWRPTKAFILPSLWDS